MQQELTSELILTFNVNLLVNVRCKHRTKQTLKLPRSKLFLMCFQACYNYYNVNCGNSTEQSKNEFKTFRALVHGIKHTAGSRPSSSVLVQCIYITYSFTECIYQYQLLVCMWLWLTWHKRVIRHWEAFSCRSCALQNRESVISEKTLIGEIATGPMIKLNCYTVQTLSFATLHT